MDSSLITLKIGVTGSRGCPGVKSNKTGPELMYGASVEDLEPGGLNHFVGCFTFLVTQFATESSV